jgi:predicted alpha-1,2-mannosidase
MAATRALLALPLLAALLAGAAAAGEAPSDEVDPFIGTGGHGHTYPGATLPFGMVQLSPDTRLTGWDGCSGYHASDDVIYGFSHTHLSGTGIPDYADILFMPLTGEPYLVNGADAGPDKGYASRFDKATERAGAGSYSVRLADDGIDVELTATERSGAQRYRFPAGKNAWVIVDLAHRDEVLESSLRLAGDREIEGMRRSTGWARDQVVYFVARFSRPWARAELARELAVVPDATAIDGKDVRARFAFGAKGEELIVRVGLSAVDVDGARRNLEAEQGNRPFDELRRAARERWNVALGRIDIEGGSAAQREIFYTALYHAMVAPNVYSDVDGRYLGMDRQIHRAEGRRQYTVFSLWDTFRSAHPLYTLIETERTREFIETFLAQYEQGGRLPVWELAANETDTMIGYHAVPVIADAWLKGIRGFDAPRALDAMLASATREASGLAAYRQQGFIGSEDDGESVSKTLEYAYDDACIAQLAEDLGRADVAREYDARSQGWRHLLDPASGFMRARRNQRWVEPFDPRRVDNHYTEANAWQYSFFVPQDVAGLIEALGGDERFVERLDALFEAESATTGREQADITGMIGQYAHGNEPSHHAAWLYHHAGRPEGSARRVRQILDELYTAEPDGLSGNEDCGQMSSWYVLAAIGLHPVTPCTDEWLIGVPLFDRVTLHLESGKRFVVRTRGVAPGPGVFIASATLDGQPLSPSFLHHAEIVRGGELVLTLAAAPGESWGRAPADRPGRMRPVEPRVPAAPFLRAEDDRFRTSVAVELASAEPQATIRFRREGSDESWTTYDGPIGIAESTRLQFFAEVGERRSPTVEASLHRIPHDWDVQLGSAPNAQYTAGGPLALIDGLRGEANWRTGGWMGFQHTDFVATVDMQAPRVVRRMGARFLQDQRSWIWMPAEVVVSVSDDGTRFREIGRMTTDVAEDAEGVVLREVVTEIEEPVEARYVRVAARSRGTIPDWHPGRGDGAFIFVDELIVE